MTGTKSAHAPRRTGKARLWLALLGVLSGSATAIDLDHEVGVAIQQSDNINLSENNPIEETVVSPRMFFEATQIGSRVELAAQGNVEYRHYVDDSFDDEVRGRFAGALNWKMIPERLDFVVQDYLSLQPVSEFVEFSPDNQQQVNVFVAGPTLHARFNPVTRGQLDLRYIDSYAEEREEFNSDRLNVAARLLRQTSRRNSLSANIEASDVSFDEGGQAADYRRYDGYVNSTMRGRRVDLLLDVGYTRLELDDEAVLAGRDANSSHPLGRATINWRMSPRSALATTLRYQLSDATLSLMEPLDFDRRNFNDFRVPDSLAEPNVFRERFARVRYTYAGDRLTLSLAPYYRRVRYEEALVEDQNRRGLVAGMDYRLGPRLTLSAYAAREDREFPDIGREDEDLVARVGLAKRFSQNWTGRMDFQRRERDSTEPGRSYDENSVMVSFSFRR